MKEINVEFNLRCLHDRKTPTLKNLMECIYKYFKYFYQKKDNILSSISLLSMIIFTFNVKFMYDTIHDGYNLGSIQHEPFTTSNILH